jgi:hypothetical protein
VAACLDLSSFMTIRSQSTGLRMWLPDGPVRQRLK